MPSSQQIVLKLEMKWKNQKWRIKKKSQNLKENVPPMHAIYKHVYMYKFP